MDNDKNKTHRTRALNPELETYTCPVMPLILRGSVSSTGFCGVLVFSTQGIQSILSCAGRMCVWERVFYSCAGHVYAGKRSTLDLGVEAEYYASCGICGNGIPR